MQKKGKAGASRSLTVGQKHGTNKNRLIARKRPGTTMTKKKRAGFLDLPGELRNQIYGYYFHQQGFKCDFADSQAQLGYKERIVIKFSRNPKSPISGLAEPESVTTVRFSRVLGMLNGKYGFRSREVPCRSSIGNHTWSTPRPPWDLVHEI